MYTCTLTHIPVYVTRTHMIHEQKFTHTNIAKQIHSHTHTHTRFLLDSGAFPALVNNEGDTPTDVAEEYEEIQDMITAKVEEQGINVDVVRSVEETIMLEDANRWALKRKFVIAIMYILCNLHVYMCDCGSSD